MIRRVFLSIVLLLTAGLALAGAARLTTTPTSRSMLKGPAATPVTSPEPTPLFPIPPFAKPATTRRWLAA